MNHFEASRWVCKFPLLLYVHRNTKTILNCNELYWSKHICATCLTKITYNENMFFFLFTWRQLNPDEDSFFWSMFVFSLFFNHASLFLTNHRAVSVQDILQRSFPERKASEKKKTKEKGLTVILNWGERWWEQRQIFEHLNRSQLLKIAEALTELT